VVGENKPAKLTLATLNVLQAEFPTNVSEGELAYIGYTELMLMPNFNKLINNIK
jgi:hypothetical protein